MLDFLIESAVKVVVVFGALVLMVAYTTWLERRVLGRIQVRRGPNRVGPFGLLQPIADGRLPARRSPLKWRCPS